MEYSQGKVVLDDVVEVATTPTGEEEGPSVARPSVFRGLVSEDDRNDDKESTEAAWGGAQPQTPSEQQRPGAYAIYPNERMAIVSEDANDSIMVDGGEATNGHLVDGETGTTDDDEDVSIFGVFEDGSVTQQQQREAEEEEKEEEDAQRQDPPPASAVETATAAFDFSNNSNDNTRRSSTPFDAELAPQTDEEIIQARMEALTVTASSVKLYSPRERISANRRGNWLYMALGLALICIVCLIVFGEGGVERGNIGENGTSSEEVLDDIAMIETVTMSPSMSPIVLARQILGAVSTYDTLDDTNSPQYRAMLWLIQDKDPIEAGYFDVTNNARGSSGTLTVEDDDSTRIVQSRNRWIERYILAVLYYSTGGPYWNNKLGFLSNRTVCSWTTPAGLGIVCNDDDMVKKIEIVVNNVTGTLPDEISSLSSLEFFTFAIGATYGTIPTTFGKLSLLQTLILSELSLTGTIPNTFGNLRKMKRLFLRMMQLTGTIPSSVYQLSNLDTLILSWNSLTGTLPPYMSSLDSGGTHTPGELSSHVVLSNFLSGSIPDSAYTPNLRDLVMSDNLLSGTLSNELGNMRQVVQLSLHSNEITGTIPSTIGKLEKAEAIHLSSNKLNGTIPNEISQLWSIEHLFLQRNELTGTVPLWPDLKHLSSIDLSFNNLSGSMDEFCSQMSPITRLIADCGSHGGTMNESVVTCPCCVQCCDSTIVDPMGWHGGCTSNPQASCKWKQQMYEHTHGLLYQQDAGTTCDCHSVDKATGNGTKGEMTSISLTCQDTSCQICNRDRSVCAVNQEYYHNITPGGQTEHYKATFQYVVGLNDTVTFEWWLLGEANQACQATVNGQTCYFCIFMVCLDNDFPGYFVDCANVDGVGTIDLCDTDEEDSGPLTIFSMQDPFFRKGCPPRLWRTDGSLS